MILYFLLYNPYLDFVALKFCNTSWDVRIRSYIEDTPILPVHGRKPLKTNELTYNIAFVFGNTGVVIVDSFNRIPFLYVVTRPVI